MEKENFATIDEYIALFPQEVQKKLQALRQVIREAAPDAEEKISYRMPTFFLHGNLVHFAAYKNHIGLYPTPTGIERFSKQLAPYHSGKGSAQFPLDQPLPLELVRDIVLFRVQENMQQEEARRKKK